MSRSDPIRRAGIAVVAAALLAGCSSFEGNKAGGAGTPIVLRMATVHALPGALPQVEYLVDRVEDLSAGNVRIDMVYQVGGFALGAEQEVVRDVAAHRYDLGVVATPVFDTLGITSFRALTAPLLIDNYPLEQAVIDSDIPVGMMGSLARVHVTGLGILGGGLWKPIAVEKPLMGADDWRGISVVVASPSNEESEAILALGARPVDASRPSDGQTSSLLTYPLLDTREPVPYVTANVNLWPRPIAVIGDPDRLAMLSPEQRAWLDEAVRDTATRSTGLVNGDAGFLSNLCAAGDRFADASDADLSALREAFAPIYADLEQDPQTKDFIAEIRRLKAETLPGDGLVIPGGCTGPATDPPQDPSTAPGMPPPEVTPLDGVWDVTYSRDELRRCPSRPQRGQPLELRPLHLGVSPRKVLLLADGPGSGRVELDRRVRRGRGRHGVLRGTDQAGTGNHGQEIWRYKWSVYRETLTFEKLWGEAPDCSLSVS